MWEQQSVEFEWKNIKKYFDLFGLNKLIISIIRHVHNFLKDYTLLTIGGDLLTKILIN